MASNTTPARDGAAAASSSGMVDRVSSLQSLCLARLAQLFPASAGKSDLLARLPPDQRTELWRHLCRKQRVSDAVAIAFGKHLVELDLTDCHFVTTDAVR